MRDGPKIFTLGSIFGLWYYAANRKDVYGYVIQLPPSYTTPYFTLHHPPPSTSHTHPSQPQKPAKLQNPFKTIPSDRGANSLNLLTQRVLSTPTNPTPPPHPLFQPKSSPPPLIPPSKKSHRTRQQPSGAFKPLEINHEMQAPACCGCKVGGWVCGTRSNECVGIDIKKVEALLKVFFPFVSDSKGCSKVR